MPEINEPSAKPKAGDQEGDFVLIRKIGAGGMGEVWLAEQRSLDRHVAIKFLLNFEANETLRARLETEAKSTARVNHPNVIQILRILNFKGFPAVVMEYIEGQTLSALFRSGHHFSLNNIFDIAEQVAKGLGAAEKHEIVHRDIKPANLLLMEDGHLKILDFGLARIGQDPAMTKAGTIMGTAHYMSPEQAAGKVAKFQSDYYALGVILYELLEGRLPFDGGNALKLMTSHLEDDIPPFTPGRVPEPLEHFVMRLLEKNPGRRPSDAKILLNNIEITRTACRHSCNMNVPTFHSRQLELKLYREAKKSIHRSIVHWRPKSKRWLYTAIVVLCTILLTYTFWNKPNLVLSLPSLPENTRIILQGNDEEKILPIPLGKNIVIEKGTQVLRLEAEFYRSETFDLRKGIPIKQQLQLEPDHALIKRKLIALLEQETSKAMQWDFFDRIYGNNAPEHLKFLRKEINRLREARSAMAQREFAKAVNLVGSLEYSKTQMVTRRFLRKARILLIPDKVIQEKLTELQSFIRQGKHRQAWDHLNFIAERRPGLNTDIYEKEIRANEQDQRKLERLFLKFGEEELPRIKALLESWGRRAPENPHYLALKKRYELENRNVYLQQQSQKLIEDLDVKNRSWNPWAFHKHLLELDQNKSHSKVLKPFINGAEKKMAELFCKQSELFFNAEDNQMLNEKENLFEKTPYLNEQVKQLEALKGIKWKNLRFKFILQKHLWSKGMLICTCLLEITGEWAEVEPAQQLKHKAALVFKVQANLKDAVSLANAPPLKLISCESAP